MAEKKPKSLKQEVQSLKSLLNKLNEIEKEIKTDFFQKPSQQNSVKRKHSSKKLTILLSLTSLTPQH